ncbi:P-loop containing nucleoside triphosphate hydrolase protein [Polychytrium aggregatum]|uniref:P-loop containing nucleoside triphosphate hydrolase protein n=1 Tax=Polychytrium aggregatum TaxID=110093 RepID=UPI0022FDB0D9|nr:P-loop containing nucleoside triphosphate hydrolase protein [Polychytrium aggregatum]KAI9199759.1 P-loop containing nucleoside triphosphate hydrolase protein [Polychytrium aggregatum]
MPPKEKKSAKSAKAAKSSKNSSVDSLAAGVGKVKIENNRSCSGVLTSQKDSRDIKIEQFSLTYFSQVLIQETTLELNFGRRYGLIGPNGSGKSTFLEALYAREVPIPDHIDIFLLNSEYPPTEMTALNAVIDDANKELARLEKLMETILEEDPESPLLDDIYERIDGLDASTFESRAASILYGLGFTKEKMDFKTKDLSGGWRMRVALARALFVKPTLLLLDQPTNHLDLGACVWLEEYLKTYNRILLIISHSTDFLNEVCTNIIELNPKRQFDHYSGNFDIYVKTKYELEVNQMKAYEKQQDEIAHIKKFIASCGTYANLVRQAKSRQKILDKMEADGLVEKVQKNREFRFQFDCSGKLPPPVLSFDDMSFAYDGNLKKNAIYKNLEFGVDTDSRIALVGPNGAGKSTLLKLMAGELSPTTGSVNRHTSLKLGRYNQHSAEQLDGSLSAVDYLRAKFPDLPQDIQYWRQKIGQYGLTGNNQLCPIDQLSDGQKSRIVFCELSINAPNIILFDEPTNALDIETIDSLAEAINEFEGGVVLVSHDFRLISQVAEQIWVCENQNAHLWEGTIAEYKAHLRKSVCADMKI